jgi:hypothetical protein
MRGGGGGAGGGDRREDCAAVQRAATGLVGGGLGVRGGRGREKQMSALELSQRSATAAELYVTLAQDIRAHAAATKEEGGGNPSCVKGNDARELGPVLSHNRQGGASCVTSSASSASSALFQVPKRTCTARSKTLSI